MPKGLISDSILTDIADAIRSKKSSSDSILVSNMATEILSIPTGGQSYDVEATVNGGGFLGMNVNTEYNDWTYGLFDAMPITAITKMPKPGSNVSNTSLMFRNCKYIESINTTGWNLSNVYTMGEMFSNCEKVSVLDLSNITTGRLQYINQLFQNMKRVKSLDISGFDIHAKSITEMFFGCESLNTITGTTGWDLSDNDVYDVHRVFKNCINLRSLDLSNWIFRSGDYSNYNNLDELIAGTRRLSSLNLTGWDMSHMSNRNLWGDGGSWYYTDPLYNCFSFALTDITWPAEISFDSTYVSEGSNWYMMGAPLSRANVQAMIFALKVTDKNINIYLHNLTYDSLEDSDKEAATAKGYNLVKFSNVTFNAVSEVRRQLNGNTHVSMEDINVSSGSLSIVSDISFIGLRTDISGNDVTLSGSLYSGKTFTITFTVSDSSPLYSQGTITRSDGETAQCDVFFCFANYLFGSNRKILIQDTEVGPEYIRFNVGDIDD